MTTNTVRTPQEIFKHHAQAMIAGDVEDILCDYADNALSGKGGRRAARQGRRACGLHKAVR